MCEGTPLQPPVQPSHLLDDPFDADPDLPFGSWFHDPTPVPLKGTSGHRQLPLPPQLPVPKPQPITPVRAHLFALTPVKLVIQGPPSPSPAEEQFTTLEQSKYEEEDLKYQDIDPTQDTRVKLPLQRPTSVPPDLEDIPEDQKDLKEQEHEIDTYIEAF